jgi:hypothetical protein
MESPALAPTPVKVINDAVLSCLDDMFLRLPFPNLSELERLIKVVPRGEALMSEFRSELRAELNTPRAIQEFESGWEKYWEETQTRRSREVAQQAMSFKERNRSPSPETGRAGGGEGGGEGGGGAGGGEGGGGEGSSASDASGSVL